MCLPFILFLNGHFPLSRLMEPGACMHRAAASHAGLLVSACYCYHYATEATVGNA